MLEVNIAHGNRATSNAPHKEEVSVKGEEEGTRSSKIFQTWERRDSRTSYWGAIRKLLAVRNEAEKKGWKEKQKKAIDAAKPQSKKKHKTHIGKKRDRH